MEQTNNMRCPACGTVRGSADTFHCSKCFLPIAFVTHFADRKAMEYRNKQIDVYKNKWHEAINWRLTRENNFALAERCVAFMDAQTRTLHRFPVGGNYEKRMGVRQISRSRNHELILLSDGTVEASGSNNFGQCVVNGLQNIAYVLAGPNVSYAVGQDGRVYARGSCPFADVVEKWRDVYMLAAGDHHLVALTKKGKVYFAGAINSPEVFRHECPWENISSIAAANDYALALDSKGKVYFAGYADDAARSRAAGWNDMAAIAADDMYAVGLTRSGDVLIAGEGGFLDRGRSEAAQWKRMISISASGGCIGGLTQDGELRLAGDSFVRRTERDRLTAEWRAMVDDLI